MGPSITAQPTGDSCAVIRPQGQLLLAAVIIAVTFLAYIPAMRAGFIWDDDTHVTNNIVTRPGGLSRSWFGAEQPDYWPVTWTATWLEWRLWGTNAMGYHVVSLVLHAAIALLIWRVLQSLGARGAWVAALIFAVHPVNVETVAWITQRKTLLAALFYVTSLRLYLQYDRTAGRRWYGASLGAFALSLLSKQIAATMPVVLWMCAWWQRGRISRADVLRSIPFFAMAGAASLTEIWFQYNISIGPEMVRTDSFFSRLASAGWVVWFYLYKALWPVHLCFVYPRWTTSVSLISFLPGLLLLAAFLLFWRYRRGWGRAPLFTLGYFAVSLLPVLGFFNIYFMRYSLVADHWQYTALIGIVALVAAGLVRVIEQGGMWRAIGIATTIGIVGVFGVLTWGQSHIYRDAETVWRETLRENPRAWLAHSCLSSVLLKKLDNKEARFAEVEICNEALQECGKAIALKPDFADAYYNRGNIYGRIGRYDLSLRDYNKAIELKPDFCRAYSNRGSLYAQVGRSAEAIRDYDRATQLQPADALTYNNRGNVYASAGRLDIALRDFEKAIELRRDFAPAYGNRANVHAAMGRYDLALRDYSKAIELRPDISVNYNARASVYQHLKEYDKALADLRTFQDMGGHPAPETLKALAEAAGKED